MIKAQLTYKGIILIPLAAFDAGSYAAMIIVEVPDEFQRASGVLGNFPTADEACRYAVEYGMAEIDALVQRPKC